jgi:serine/threonine protein kinase/lipopolysaccharide biosynthesis regulator YciM
VNGKGPAIGVDEVYFAALERDEPGARAAYLDEACGNDAGLRRRVERLLAARSERGSFLESPAPGATLEFGSVALSEGPGAVLGPYKILEAIGEGGMGTVYMAEQVEPVRRRVALKLIKAGMNSRQILARFGAERQALALMDHPNIAKVLDAGTSSDGRPYFVMELVKGIPITRFCDERRLTLRERLELVIPVCHAVQHAHQKGIIHRDLKPSNVLIALYDGQPVPKVIDFGVAKATGPRLTDQTVCTEFGAIVGTLEYMSPEQAELNQLDIDTRSDIYSLGVLLYELLTGSTPLEHKRLKHAAILEALRVIREEESPRPSLRLSTTEELPSVAANRNIEPHKLSGLVRGELDWIVMKALERDRTRRYETADALAADLRRYLDDETIHACPPSRRYRLGKFARKHRVPLVTISAFVLLLMLGATVSAWQAIVATRARNEAQAVLKFFEDQVLAAARPEGKKGGLGKDVTIRNAIDAAEPKIAVSFRDQPTVEASVRNTLGKTYFYLGEPALAIRQQERALELRKRELGPDHAETLASRISLASTYRQLGLSNRAMALDEETLKLATSRFGGDHPLTIESRNSLADAYADAFQTAEAIALFEENLRVQTAKLGPDHPETINTRNGLGEVNYRASRTARAIELHQANLKAAIATLGPDNPDTLIIRNNLGDAYLQAGEPAKAIAQLEETLTLYISNVGPDHPDTLISRSNLANACRAAGRTAEAIALHEENFSRWTAKFGPEHGHTLLSSNYLAMAYAAAGLFAKAEPILRQCLTIRERDRPDEWWTFQTFSQLGGCLLGQAKFAEAEPPVLRGYEGLKAREATIWPGKRYFLTEAGEQVVQLYEAWGKKDKAAEWRKTLASAHAGGDKSKP